MQTTAATKTTRLHLGNGNLADLYRRKRERGEDGLVFIAPDQVRDVLQDQQEAKHQQQGSERGSI